MLCNLLNNIILKKNVLADDEESIIKDDNQLIPESSDKEDKSLKDKLKSDVSKAIIKTLTGHFKRIKIDGNLLKKNILNVRYINSNRKIDNKFLKEDYQISNNTKNAI